MKNIYLLILLFIGINASAQSPDKMSYQAVLRDANGEILKNQSVSIQFSVLQTSITGTSVYQEDHKLTTNSNGLVSVYIGTGTINLGDVSKIDWSKGPYFLQSEIDPNGGTNYVIRSTSELVSVPYALYANKAEFADSLTGGVNETDPVFDASIAKGITVADTAYWNNKLDGYIETDPVFDASVANGITASDTTYWNGKLDSSSIQNFIDLTSNQTVTGEITFSSDLLVNDITIGSGRGGDSTNTAIGYEALDSNTTGNFNTANGYNALNYNTTGRYNTANGSRALYSNTTGNFNTANGYNALSHNTTGSYNTANGNFALSSNTTGNNNTANGYGALYSNTKGTENTANGYIALFRNTTGYNNVANGNGALYLNTTGNSNTANGNGALYFNTGNSNTANGTRALYFNTIGNSNTANGYSALLRNTTGYNNVANGYSALLRNTTGNNNTAIGDSALWYNETGDNNTALGSEADVNQNNLTNSTAIGYKTTVISSNRVRIGNTSVRIIEGQVAWTNTSDGRIKENVQEAVPGLSFISELRPVTYTLNTKKQDEITMQAMPDSIKEKRMLSDEEYLESSSIVRTGFIAQEVEAAARKVGFDFDGVSAPENETDLYGIRYAEFVVPLVKAVQEQQEMIDKQTATIEQQTATIEQQTATIEQQRNDYLLLLERVEALERE